MGQFHMQLEEALCEYLKVPYISLFTNGTLPLLTALQALRITGEVITTPYSFVATTHSIWWNGCRPVFVDIEDRTCGIDPEKIEAAITPKTTAIMPVHCYGKPVNIKAIQEIADKYGLKVIYDAAHAFGVEVNGESILNAGDMSTLSFHATKVYMVIGGEPYLLKIGDRYLGKPEDNLDRQQMATVMPSRYTNEYLAGSDKRVKAMIKKMGITFGAVSFQGFYENGQEFMYDPGLRFPGSDYDLILKQATGFDPM